ncbi:hypothetical protein [Actinacidiphila glaucinigra]|uniref:hypothetical protein n=1 Tax=Actinacidiphila glaucinigra TaxID=235986 RepID=UPI0035DA9315
MPTSVTLPVPLAAVPGPRRPRRSRVRHGQASCADYGCARLVCRQAARRARYRRERDHAAGLPARVEPAQAAEHAALLRRRGMAAQDIADASGISVTLVRRLLRPPTARPGRIARTTADAVLGVHAPAANAPNTGGRGGGRGLTDAAHAAAILNALAAAGWPATYLAARLGISTQAIAAIRDHKRPQLRIPLDQAICRLYPRLAGTSPAAAGIPPGTIARALAHHQRRHATGQSPATTA